MIKKYLSVFGILLAVPVLLVLALTALAQVRPSGSQMPGAGRHGAGATPPAETPTGPGKTTLPGASAPGGMTESKGTMQVTLSGEVVNVDHQAGIIEIIHGHPQRFEVAESAKRQLSKIKKGDHVQLNVVVRAVDDPAPGKEGAPRRGQ